MRQTQPPRDRVSQAGGAGAAILLLAALGYAVAGPAARMAIKPLSDVWVTIIRPAPPKPPALRPAPAATQPR